MSLTINSLYFSNFRNYPTLSLDDFGLLTVFVGQNAIGKTNIIEGIQLMTSLQSFRHPKLEHLLLDSEKPAQIKISADDGNRLLDVELRITDKKKQYILNGKNKRAVELKGLIPSVVFTPDDLDLVKGSHSKRRDTLDLLGSQLSPNYYTIRHDYDNVLKHKNKLLKNDIDPMMLDSINEMVIQVGSQLSCYRAALLKKYIVHVIERYEALSSNRETLQIMYTPSWEPYDEMKFKEFSFTRDDAKEKLYASLQSRVGEEIARHKSVVGPHADRIDFFIDGKNAAIFGSQGQQRTIVLACKLAEVAVIEEMLQQKPILLLDDVMSELDQQRRKELISYIENGIQAFITTANLSYFDEMLPDYANMVALPLDGR